MAEQRLSDEHAHETDATASPISRQRLKRRGLIAGAAVLAAGVLAKQAAVPVSAWDSTHTFQSATGAATSLSPDVYADGIQGYADGGNNAGVFGRNNALNGIGISGIAPSGIGVSGTSTSGPGVSGASTSSYGVVGTTGTVNAAGIAGYTSTSGAIAVAGTGSGGTYGAVFAGPVQATTSTGNAINAGSTGSNSIVATGYNGAAGLVAQANDAGSWGMIVNGFGLTAGSNAIFVNGAVWVHGNFTAYGGSKSAAVPFPDGSHRLLYCVESPESWFEDFGQGQLSGGKATVALDPDFAAVIVTQTLLVFLTPEGDTNGLYVSGKTQTGFVVQEQKGGTSNAGFTYRVVAKRKDITGTRLAPVTLPPPVTPVPGPEPIALPGMPAPPTLPAVDTRAAPAATPAPAPAGVRSAATTAAPPATNTPVATTATGTATAAPTATATPSGTPAVVATPRTTGSATNLPASSTPSGSVAPAPPRR